MDKGFSSNAAHETAIVIRQVRDAQVVAGGAEYRVVTGDFTGAAHCENNGCRGESPQTLEQTACAPYRPASTAPVQPALDAVLCVTLTRRFPSPAEPGSGLDLSSFS